MNRNFVPKDYPLLNSPSNLPNKKLPSENFPNFFEREQKQELVIRANCPSFTKQYSRMNKQVFSRFDNFTNDVLFIKGGKKIYEKKCYCENKIKCNVKCPLSI